MMSMRPRTKVKNSKIESWRLEMSSLRYHIKYWPGKLNVAADRLSRSTCASVQQSLSLQELHERLRHPGLRGVHHYVRQKNLPFALQDVKHVCNNCKVCAEIKPCFDKLAGDPIIKALYPFDRISIELKRID